MGEVIGGVIIGGVILYILIRLVEELTKKPTPKTASEVAKEKEDITAKE